MKKKLFMAAMLLAAGATSMAACGQTSNSDEKPGSEVSTIVEPSTTSVTSEQLSVSEEPGTSEVSVSETVKVTSISLEATKTTASVSETVQLTATVLPENADDKTVTYSVDDDDVATVSATGLVTPIKGGTVTVTATANDGSGITGEISIEFTCPEPTITLSSEEDITVAAGATCDLPTYTAKDYDDTDLSEWVEIEDAMEGGTILSGNKFSSKVAGKHVISYYVCTEDERETQVNINVNVTPANAETFDTTGCTDPNAIGTYGTFKENFSNPFKSGLGVNGPTGGVWYSSTADEAISGNSMVIDANKTAGSAANQVFLNGFNNIFKKDGTQVTYSLECDYKIITSNNNMSDFYMSLFWDGSSGLNVNGFIQDGQVHHMSAKWPQITLESGKNAWFGFWKLNVSGDDAIIVIDNVVVKAEECAQATSFTPTTDQLKAEGGVTWDMEEKAFTSTNGEIMLVNSLDDTLKETISGNSNYSANVLHLTNADGHLASCLTRDNLEAGDILDIELYYYSVNNGGFNLIMMGDSGNPTLKITDEDLGDGFHKVTTSCEVVSGFYQLNIYGAGNPNFDVYIGKMTAKLSERSGVPGEQETIPTGTLATTDQLKAGYTWDQSPENFAKVDNAKYYKIADMDNTYEGMAGAKEAMVGCEGFADYATRFTGGYIYGVPGAQLVAGYILTVEFDFYQLSDGLWGYIIMLGKDDGNNKPAYQGAGLDANGFGYEITTISGNLKHFKLVTLVNDNLAANPRDAAFTAYNGSPDVFIGKITAKLTKGEERPTIEELSGETGASWDMVSRGESFAGVKGVAVSSLDDEEVKADLAGYDNVIKLSGMEVARFSGLNGDNVNGKSLLDVTLVYYVKNGDSGLAGGSAAALYNGTGMAASNTPVDKTSGKLYTLTMQQAQVAFQDGASNGFALYGAGTNFTLYIVRVDAKLTAIAGPSEKTAINFTSFYGKDGGDAGATWDAGTCKFTVDAATKADATLWFSINAASSLKSGSTYVAKFTINYADYAGGKLCIRQGGSFTDFEFTPVGNTSRTYEIPFVSNGDGFFGLYETGGTGSFTISSVAIVEDPTAKLFTGITPQDCNFAAATRTATFNGGDASLWLSTAPHGLEVGETYLFKFTISYASDFACECITMRLGSVFQNFDAGALAGTTQTYCVPFNISIEENFLGIFVSKGNGSLVISPVTAYGATYGYAGEWYGFDQVQQHSGTSTWSGNGSRNMVMAMQDGSQDCTLWIATNLTAVENDKYYVISFNANYGADFVCLPSSDCNNDTATSIQMRQGSRWTVIDKSMTPGLRHYEVTIKGNGDGFFGIYFKNCVGTVHISGLSIVEASYGSYATEMTVDGGDTAEHSSTNRARQIDLNVPSADSTVWFRLGSLDTNLEDEKVYAVRFTLRTAEGFSMEKLCFRMSGNFYTVDSGLTGNSCNTYTAYLTGAQINSGDYFGLYFLHGAGTCFVDGLSVTPIE